MNIRWPKEKVFEIARTCTTRCEFKYKCKPAYEAAHRHNWIDEMTWFEDGRKKFAEKRRIWTHDTVIEEAKKYTCKRDFADGAPGAYNVARENGWLDEMTWFQAFSLPRGYWTYETCYAEAQKYTTKLEFCTQGGRAYDLARREGWLEDYVWLQSDYVTRGYWTYENCYNAAKQFEYKKDFMTQNHKAYDAAFSKGWLSDYKWLKDRRLDIIDGSIDSVYVYEFPDNVIYVGRTLITEQANRQIAHRTKKDSAVYKYANKMNIEIPQMRVIETNLTLAEGVEREGYWMEWYKENGWTLLNVAPAGSIGGLAKGKWSRKKIVIAALKYKTLKDFRENDSGAYVAAQKRGMLSEFTWLEQSCKPNGYWTKERCYEEAKKYNSPTELRKGNPHVHKLSSQNHWMKDYWWFNKRTARPSGYWTEETCFEAAKECTTITEFQAKFPQGYKIAHNNDWIKNYVWFVNGFEIAAEKARIWTYEKCKEESEKYNTKFEFRKKSYKAYIASRKNGWLKEFFPNDARRKNYVKQAITDNGTDGK